MSVKSMKLELASIKQAKPKPVDATNVSDDETSWLDATATFAGAVPSATLGFFGAVRTSFQYHEAKRKGLI